MRKQTVVSSYYLWLSDIRSEDDLSTTEAADLWKYQIKDYLLLISVTDQTSILQSYIQTLIYHSNTHFLSFLVCI